MKKLVSMALALLMCVMVAVPAMAALTSTTLSGGNGGTNVYSWSPTITDVRYDASGGKLRVVSYFKWNSSNVNTVIDIPSDLFYTMEHCNPNDNGVASYDDLYSNVPYAYYDVEDDENNGYTEELEVSCYSNNNPSPFIANANYFFDTTWHNTTSTSKKMYCAVRSQRSMYAAINGEMQAHATEFHGRTATYNIAAGGSRSVQPIDVATAKTTQATFNVATEKPKVEPILISVAVPTEEAAKNEMKNQWEVICEESTPQIKELLSEGRAVVTFAEPLNNFEVNEILQSADATPEKYVLRYEDGNGNRITGWTDDISDNHLQEKLAYLREVHGDVSFSGIVSADVLMDLTNEAEYKELADNENVYLIDISDPVVRIENEDYNKAMVIRVPDVSWQLEK